GITFDGRLGLMQGIIATPNGDVWALGISKRQFIHIPKGDWTKGRIVCEGDSAEPCKSFLGPFHLAIDQQDRIWVSNASDKVTRFPAADPSKVENFRTGIINGGLNIDSQGNVWVTNRFGRTYGELPARLQDRRPDLAARRLRGRRATDADRPRQLILGRRVGDEQLAGHRQLLRQRQGGALDALRRPRRRDLLRHGQAGACTADRAGPATVVRV